MIRTLRRGALRRMPPALAVFLAATLLGAPIAQAAEAIDILRTAFDNWRAGSSHATVEMTVARPSGVRKLTMESWTEGKTKALVRFTAPARDAGNATLQLDKSTYVFNPRLNQVIKLPASAMAQSWMGSDFSYDDLSRSEKVIDDYTHRLIETRSEGGHLVHVIESIPKRGAPVVWGKQVISVRDDGVLHSVAYYDQLGARVRIMTTDRIAQLSGRPYPVVLTMRVDAKPGQYTQVVTIEAVFDIPIPSYLFTRSNLRNPRR